MVFKTNLVELKAIFLITRRDAGSRKITFILLKQWYTACILFVLQSNWNMLLCYSLRKWHFISLLTHSPMKYSFTDHMIVKECLKTE